MLNSRYLQRGFWLLAIGTPKSGDVQRCPKMFKDVQRCPAESVSSAPDCPTSPTINTLSLQQQHKNHPHHYQRHHHHHHVYHHNRTHQKRRHENFAKLRVAGICNFVHISDTSTEYVLTLNV